MKFTRRASRWIAVVLVASALAAVCALSASGVASAHANLDRAEPAPGSTLPTSPRVVRIWFTEPLLATASGIEVLNTTGRRVDLADSKVDIGSPTSMSVSLPALLDGTYTVAWHNTSSADGHPLRNTYAFTVGVGTPGASAASGTTAAVSGVSAFDPFVRWIVLAGLLVALGVEWFALVVLPPTLAQRELRGVTVEIDRRIVGGALATFAIGSLIHLGLQLQNGSGIVALLTEGRWGQMWLLRAVLVALAAATWLRSRGQSRWRRATFVLLALAASTLAFASHAAGLRDLEVPAVANDIIHTVAAGIWVGGLVALLAVIRTARPLADARRRALLATITQRFSPLAMLATAALLITGTYATWIEVASRSAFATPYGYAVAAKVILYAALIAVAATNLLWITRRLHDHPRTPRLLAATVTTEVALVLVALLAAGFLTSLEPARSAFGQGAAVPRSPPARCTFASPSRRTASARTASRCASTTTVARCRRPSAASRCARSTAARTWGRRTSSCDATPPARTSPTVWC